MLQLSAFQQIVELSGFFMSFYCDSPIGLFLFAALVISCSGLASGQSVPGPVRGEPIQLFDGKSLQGWSKQNGTPAKNWAVEDGAICWKSRVGDLYHEHWYRDFELAFHWKIGPDGNSGVKYRVQPYGNRMLGCEYQLFDDKQILFGNQSTGSLYALFEPSKNKVTQPLGEWNQSKIVVCGNHVEHWLNGVQVVDATFGSPEWNRRVTSSKFNKHDRFGLNREGRIFLQDHGKPVWFREIVVTPIDCDRPTGLPNCVQPSRF